MNNECPRCDGTGFIEIICRHCSGSGEGMHEGAVCRHCKGDGGDTEECDECRGSGYLDAPE